MNDTIVLKSDRIVWVDVDDTLIGWDLSAYKDHKPITINHVNGPVLVVPNQKNINTIIKFYKLGYTIVVHSGSGHGWAKKVVDSLRLKPYVSLIMSKPLYYFDDKPVETWAGYRVWRDPKGREG